MRQVIKRCVMGCALWFLSIPSVSALDLELTQGINAALPIAIHLMGNDSEAQQLDRVISQDLSSSGQFKLIAMPVRSDDIASAIASYKQAGADSVLSGRLDKVGYQRVEVNIELRDVATNGRLLLTKRYQVSTRELRSLAHHISDEVYQKLTGVRGVFSTRIAYILAQRQGERHRYSLEVADMDGENPQRLLVSSEPIMSPSWSPDGRQIAYVSFERRRAQIFVVTVETGQRRLITDFPGINGAPAWSPDGRELAVVLSKESNPKIYSVDLANGRLKQLTFGNAIDTEPRYAPDGRSIIFTSGRGGSPQIYRLTLADGSITRLSFDGNYNARASFTPNEKSIVMLHRDDHNVYVGVQQLDDSHVLPVASSMDESPSIAPNGRMILYGVRSQGRGILGVVSIDGRTKRHLPARDGDLQDPAWSPYLG